MKKIINDLKQYFLEIHKGLFLTATVFISTLIFINYRFGLNEYVGRLSPAAEYFAWLGIFLAAFSFAYLFPGKVINNAAAFKDSRFVFFIFLAPAIFAWKMSAAIQLPIAENAALNNYWNKVVYWPIKLVVIATVLFVIWRLFDKEQPFYGSIKAINFQPYIWMLAIMIPLVALASTLPDFQETYPKLKEIELLYDEKNHWWQTILYELSYGSDFLGIELFFRGFLILGFATWVGKDAILPMALFYCTIHFGKPIGECISSFFGGLLLGVVTYHTRSIYGGLMVHLGIAWMMELVGYISSQYAAGTI